MSQIVEGTITTPGVYINEIPSFPPSVPQVATAIPAFIGYTETDTDSKGNSWNLKPKRITSLLEYQQTFGGAPEVTDFSLTVTEFHDSTGNVLTSTSVAVANSGSSASPYLMYYALQMYFMNGGGPCYIVSVKKYTDGSNTVSDTDLQSGLDALVPADEPTLILFPDGQGITNSAKYYTLQNNALSQCAKLEDRFALIDILDNSGDTTQNIANFRSGIGNNNLNYGACYYPNLMTTLSSPDSAIPITIAVDSGSTGNPILTSTHLNGLAAEYKSAYNQGLTAVQALGIIIAIPPSAVMAGVMATIDATLGVWEAPANVSLNGVFALTDTITDEEQGTMNVDPSTGKSVNAIRAFTGKGILVWGARTLDGNSNDFRYVSVRRLFIMAEESVKDAMMQFVFKPNDSVTWTSVGAMIGTFLTNLWRQGALAGAKPAEAYYVKVGLGQTMTFDDILNGRMIVEIGMAPVRPAEFIILRFTQIQQTS